MVGHFFASRSTPGQLVTDPHPPQWTQRPPLPVDPAAPAPGGPSTARLTNELPVTVNGRYRLTRRETLISY